MKNLLFLFLSIFLFASCGSKTTTEDENEMIDETTEITSEMEEEEVSDSEKTTIKAKFVEFQLGDSEHYVFEDESGKTLDFAGNSSDEYEFAIELSDSEVTDENQGFGSNKELQGKWFNVTYVKKEQSQTIGEAGPMVAVEVIEKIELAE